MKVSCAMIVRDSEATIERALVSVRPHVDELVVVDTGSADRTPEISANYADLLLGFRWVDDFAAARQHAFDASSGEWIIHLDADDQLHGGEYIRAACAAAPDQATALYWRYVTGRAADGEPTMQFWRERCVRRGRYRWAGRAHEVLVATGASQPLRDERTWVDHLPPPGKDDRASLARNVRYLRAEMADQGEHPNSRTLFYLARDMVMLNEGDEALPLLDRYMDLPAWDDEKYLAQLMVGYIHRLSGRYRDAAGEDLAATLIHPTWPDAYYALAEDYYYLEQWDRVRHWSEIGQRLAPPATDLFVAPRAYAFGWIIYYSVALYHLGDYAGALAATQRALAIAPDDPQHRHNLAAITRALTETVLQEHSNGATLRSVASQPAPV